MLTDWLEQSGLANPQRMIGDPISALAQALPLITQQPNGATPVQQQALSDGTILSDDPNAGFLPERQLTQQQYDQGIPDNMAGVQTNAQPQSALAAAQPFVQQPDMDDGSLSIGEKLGILVTGGGFRGIQQAEQQKQLQTAARQQLTPDQYVSRTGDLDGAYKLAQIQQLARKPLYAPQSTQGKIRADAAAGLLSPEEADRALRGNGTDAPSGYRYNAAGNLEAIPGGPSDPNVQKPSKPIPASLQKDINDRLDKISVASGSKADLGKAIEQIDSGKLDFGVVSNLTNRAKNYLGNSDEKSKNFSSFRSTLEKARNDSLRLNKGVQTEGDAQRAWNELFENINDKDLVRQRLGEIQEINDRAANNEKLVIDRVNEEYGRPAQNYDKFTNQPAALGAGRDSVKPPAAAIQHLQSNPALKSAFDAKYGKGAADRVLNGN